MILLFPVMKEGIREYFETRKWYGAVNANFEFIALSIFLMTLNHQQRLFNFKH
jgi:hypothetical protein